MPLLVRPAAPAEFDAVGALTADVYSAEALAGSAYIEALRDARARAAAPATELLIAVQEATRHGREVEKAGADLIGSPSTLLGAVTFCLPGSPWAMDAQVGEAEMRMLVVTPTARRSGVGAALIAACIERARDVDATRLVLSTKQIMTSARRLYGRLGFYRLPERDRTLRPDVVLLAYALELCQQDSPFAPPSPRSTQRSAS